MLTTLGVVLPEVDCFLLKDQVQPLKHSVLEVFRVAFKLLVAS